LRAKVVTACRKDSTFVNVLSMMECDKERGRKAPCFLSLGIKRDTQSKIEQHNINKCSLTAAQPQFSCSFNCRYCALDLGQCHYHTLSLSRSMVATSWYRIFRPTDYKAVRSDLNPSQCCNELQ